MDYKQIKEIKAGQKRILKKIERLEYLIKESQKLINPKK